MCSYHGYDFGAPYPDAQCIDGYLWDEDSCDVPGGDLYSGGDIPCRQCNWHEFVSYIADDDRWQRLRMHVGIWWRHMLRRCPEWCPICERAPLRFLRAWSRSNQLSRGDSREP